MSSPRGVSALLLLLLLLLLLTLFLTPGALGDCGPPERLDTAEVKGAANSYSVGSSVRYSCRPGYQLIAGMTPTARCLDSSTWSAVSEFCEGKRCPSLDLMNGRIDYLTDNRFGATANFRCNEGYRLIGAFSAKCVLSSSDSAVVWDKELPFCESKMVFKALKRQVMSSDVAVYSSGVKQLSVCLIFTPVLRVNKRSMGTSLGGGGLLL
uniref:Sushi domain-containing protein n=1 Tax=Sphenodon punctatus TaxID=8508 RepID=A0A8D0H559_SPHPU